MNDSLGVLGVQHALACFRWCRLQALQHPATMSVANRAKAPCLGHKHARAGADIVCRCQRLLSTGQMGQKPQSPSGIITAMFSSFGGYWSLWNIVHLKMKAVSFKLVNSIYSTHNDIYFGCVKFSTWYIHICMKMIFIWLGLISKSSHRGKAILVELGPPPQKKRSYGAFPCFPTSCAVLRMG